MCNFHFPKIRNFQSNGMIKACKSPSVLANFCVTLDPLVLGDDLGQAASKSRS